MLPLKLDKDDNTKEKESELERKKENCQCLQKNILYRENQKDAIKNLLEIIYESIKLQEKNYMQKSV